MKKNKRGIVKLGVFFAILFVIAIISFSIFSSAYENPSEYALGDKVKINLRGFSETTLKIKTPSQTILEKTNKNFFILELNELGKYVVDTKSIKEFQRFEFIVTNPNKIQETEQIQTNKETPENFNKNQIIDNLNESNKTKTQIKVGEPVKNYQKIQETNGKKAKLNIPLSATGLSIDNPQAEMREQESFLGNVFNPNEKQIIIETPLEEGLEELIIEYETPGPEKVEKQISKSKKQVTISSEPGLHYQDVLAFTTIQEIFTFEEKDQIKIYWKEENIYLDFEAYDTNDNGLIDYLEWIVPHLSEQNFEIILITNAMHLDSERNFVQDVFELVNEKDKKFAIIPNQEYLRVKFETSLVPGKDITIYAKSEEETIIEVYEKNSNDLLTTFENVNNYGEYKIILTNLKTSQDTFDLKIIGGEVLFDYVYDPEEILFVDSYDGTYTAWTEVGSNPYLNDTTGSYITSRGDNTLEGNFGFENSKVGDGIIDDAIMYFETSADDAPNDDGFGVFVNNGSGFTLEGTIQPSSTGYAYETLNVSHRFKSWTAVDAAQIYLQMNKVGGTDDVYIQRAYLYIKHQEPDLTAPNVTLLTPADGNETFNPSVLFNASIDDNGEGLKNQTLYGNWSGGWHANETKTITGSEGFVDFTKTINDGYYSWNVFVCDNSDNCQFNESNSSFRVDTTQPYVEILYPGNFTNHSNSYLNVNYTSYDLGVGVDSCWYSNDTYSINYTLESCINISNVFWSEGFHDVVVWVNDTLGYENSSHVKFYIDTTPPTVVLDTPSESLLINYTPYLLNASSSSDNGIGLANATWYYSNTTHSWQKIGQDLDYSDNLLQDSWTITLQDGLYNITVNVSDNLGNENFTTNQNIILDLVNENPVCTIVYPNGQEQSNNSIYVSASVSEPDPNDVVKNVTFYYSSNNGTSWTLIGTNNTENLDSYTYLWDTTGDLDSIDYLVNCTAIDTRYGQNTDISNYNFTIDNTPPIIYNNYTNATDFLINEFICINTSVFDNIVGIEKVIAEIDCPTCGIVNQTLYDDGLTCDTISGDGVYSYALKLIYEGIYNLTGIHAIDSIGNPIFNSSNLNWTVTSNSFLIANMLEPSSSVEINESEQNTYFNMQCNITCDATGGDCDGVEISAEYDSTGSGDWTDILPATLDLENNETIYSCGDILRGESCYRTFNITAGEDSGGNTWDVRCHGESTNAAADFSTSQSLHVNNNPEASFAYPLENDWLSGSSETLDASSSIDSDGAITNYVFEIDDHLGFTTPIEICNGASTTCNLDTKAQSECSNETSSCYLRITVLENDGLTNSTIIQVGIDNIGPVTNLDFPKNDSFINASEYQIINATPSDSGSGINCTEFSAYYDEGWNIISVDCSSPYSYNWDLSGISDQFNVEVRARANDSENNFGDYETHGNITHDATPPTIILDYPQNNTLFSTTQVKFNFTQEDFFSNYSNCSIYINAQLNQTNQSTKNSTITDFTIQSFTPGEYYWFINCTDNAINTGTSELRKIIIDLTPPDWAFQNQSRGISPITRYYKGEEINLSALWQDNYDLGNAILSTNETGIWKNVSGMYSSPQAITGGNLTSFNWSNSTLENGTYVSWRIYGNDSGDNSNATDIFGFRIWGYSEISSSYLYPSGIPEGDTTTIYCGVRDNVSLGNLEGYSVSFYDSGSFLGTNNTQGDGIAQWSFLKATAGAYTITCNITNKDSIYYAISGNHEKDLTLGVGYGFQVYDYTNITFHHAYEGLTTNPTTEVGNYLALEYYDASSETHIVDQTGAYAYQKFDLRIDQLEAQVIDFNVTWSGYGRVNGDGTDGYILYLWNETLGDWQTEVTYTGGDTEQTNSLYYSNGFEDFINASGFVQVLVRSFDDDGKNQDTAEVGTNYIKVEIKYDILPPIVILYSPENYANFSNPEITFNCSADDDQNIINVSLKTNFNGLCEINETNSSGIDNVNYSFTKIPSDGTYLWNCFACDEAGNCGFAELNNTVTVDTIAPLVNLTYPLNDTNFSNYFIDYFNYTVSDTNGISNCSLYGDWNAGWHNNETVLNPEKDENNNFSNKNMSVDGYYVWNVLCFDFSGNSAFNSTNFSFSNFYPISGLNNTQINISQTSNDGKGDVVLAWGDSGHNDKYVIYSSTSSSGPFTYLAETTEKTYTDTTASNDRRKFYRISSWNPISENISLKVIGKTIYYFERKPSVNTRNWMSLYLSSNLSDASEVLNEINNITSFNYWNATLQTRVACNTFSCPAFPGCPPETCDFPLGENGTGYEVYLNATKAQFSNWSQAGEIKNKNTIDLVKNTTSFGKNWIGIHGNTSLTDADSLYATLSFTDTMTSWDISEQTSIPYIPNPWPGMPFLGENFLIEKEKAYEISVTQDTTYTQT